VVDDPSGAAASGASGSGDPLQVKKKSSRHLHRSDTDVCVARIMTEKLAGYCVVELKSIMGATSQKSAYQFIAEEVRRQRKTGGRVSSSFWGSFFQEFDVPSTYFSDVASADDPSGDEPISDEILEALVHVQHASPAMRRCDVFTAMMDCMDSCNFTELKSMAQAILQGPKVTRANSLRMAAAVLQTVGRLALHTKFPSCWGKARDDWDAMFTEYASFQVKSDEQRPEFMVACEHAYLTLMDMEHAWKVRRALNGGQTLCYVAL